MKDIAPAEERGKLGELGIHTARQIIQTLRRREFDLVTSLAHAKVDFNHLTSSTESMLIILII